MSSPRVHNFNRPNASVIAEDVSLSGAAGYNEGDPAVPRVATDTGAMLVHDRAKSPITDGIRAHVPEPTPAVFVPITNATTAYVFSPTIDCSDYDRIALHPFVVTTGAVTCTWKIQFSMDGTNWFDDPFESSFGAAAGNERIPTVDTVTPQFNGAVAGFAPLNAALSGPRIVQKKARYCRVGQKNSAATNTVVNYYYSLL